MKENKHSPLFFMKIPLLRITSKENKFLNKHIKKM